MKRYISEKTGCVAVVLIYGFVALINLAWMGLLAWGIFELIQYLQRH